MPNASASYDTTARAVDEAFLHLIYTDRDLLAAEFEAIVAAGWPTPPAIPPGPDATAGRPTRGPAHRAANPVACMAPRAGHPGAEGWVRPRSPPPKRPCQPQKGR
jgi:hypothetical protein